MTLPEESSISGSVTLLLKQLKSGDASATNELFQVYFSRLAGLARTFLPPHRRRTADEEDLAIQVMASFFEDATGAQMPELRSRHDVWRMLARRLQQRASNQRRDDARQKRGGGMVGGESVFMQKDGAWDPNGIHQVAKKEDCATEEQLVELERLNSQLIDNLDDPVLKDIAVRILQGETPEQIAISIGRSRATIYRKMERIREAWVKAQD